MIFSSPPPTFKCFFFYIFALMTAAAPVVLGSHELVECTFRISNIIIDNPINDTELHRRMVETPEVCDGNSSLITVEIANFQKSFLKEKYKLLSDGNFFEYWYGENNEDGSAFNFVKDNIGTFRGTLIDITTKQILQFFSDETGSMFVTVRKPSDFEREEDPDDEDRSRNMERKLKKRPMKSSINCDEGNTTLKHSVSLQKSPPIITTTSSKRSLYDDLGGNLDIMVLWSEQAECENANLGQSCTLTQSTHDQMMALVNLAIEETNTAFTLSGVFTELLLVHAYRHTGHIEEGFDTTLDKLRDNKIPNVHFKRGEHGADIVAMITADSGCGRGFHGPSLELMFSVTSYKCATGVFSFGHEVGHNLGLQHDRGTENECDTTLFPEYNYGYKENQAVFRTIMAYDCTAGQCDNNLGVTCPRIQRYSTPNSNYNGMPIGTVFDDSVRYLNGVRAEVAAYYTHGIPTYTVGLLFASTGLTGRNGVMFDLETLDDRVTVYAFDCLLNEARSNTLVQIYATSTSDTSYEGNEQDPSQWTLLMETTTSWSDNEIMTFILDFPLRIEAKSVRGIYVTIETNTPNVLYVATGTSVGTVMDSTEHLIIKEGSFNNHLFGSFTVTRGFVGRARYLVGWSCDSSIDCDDNNDFTQDLCVNNNCEYVFITDVCGNGICETSNDEYCATCPEDCSANCVSLSSPFPGSSSLDSKADGIMFDIVATSDITVYQIEAMVVTCDACYAELYTKAGNFDNNEQWTSVYAGFTLPGSTNRMTVPVNVALPISSGSRQAFYLTLQDGDNLRFKSDMNQGDVVSSNGDLSLYAGRTLEYVFGTFNNFNGAPGDYQRFFGEIKYESGLITCYENCNVASCPCPNCYHSATINPDPHYTVWDNSYYDFQGGCDQIAVRNDILEIQIRTRPRSYYSAITQIAIRFKKTGEIFHVETDSGVHKNTLTSASEVTYNYDSTSSRHTISFDGLIDSYIRCTEGDKGLTLQIRGHGSIFCGSEGMLGHWDDGGVKYPDGTSYDTSSGWVGTRATSISLAQKWMVGAHPNSINLLKDPSNVCDASSSCDNPGDAFSCTSTRRERDLRDLQVGGSCTTTSCDFIENEIVRGACEQDLELSGGDTSWTCQSAYTDPVIEDVNPCDFLDGDCSATCIDSDLRLKIKTVGGKYISRSCKWVKAKKTAKRCAMEGVSAACPLTCNACNNCEDPPSELKFKFMYKGKLIKRSCDFVRRLPNKVLDRCEKSGNICRATCNAC